MKCEDLKFNLSLYTDDDLSSGDRIKLTEHLAQCPVCRAKYAETVALRNELRVLSRPPLPENLLYAVRSAVAAEIEISNQPKTRFSQNFREWMQFRLLPYGVGTVTSLVLVAFFLTAILQTKEAAERSELAKLENKRAVMMTDSNSYPLNNQDSEYPPIESKLTEADLAAMRVSVSGESPSLNPKGALALLTKSLSRGQMKNDEVVLVADVFGNGLAKIAEIVEAPRSRQSLEELEYALQNNDPAYKAFVPAKLDNRSDVVRVVLKIQRVDVVYPKSPARRIARK